MEKIKFKIATPEKVVFESEVDQITCPTQLGEVTILANHIPLVANLVAGELKIVSGGDEQWFFVAGGFLEVRGKNEVMILADAAEREDEINMERAEAAKARAKKLMEEKTVDAEEFAQTQAALERSLFRIKLGKRRRPPRIDRQISEDIS